MHIQRIHQNIHCYQIFLYREFHIHDLLLIDDDFLELNHCMDMHFEDIYKDFWNKNVWELNQDNNKVLWHLHHDYPLEEFFFQTYFLFFRSQMNNIPGPVNPNNRSLSIGSFSFHNANEKHRRHSRSVKPNRPSSPQR